MANIDSLLRKTVELGASDLHISVGIPPYVRIDGRLMPLQYPALSVDDCNSMAKEILGEKGWQAFLQSGEYDLSYSVPGLARFRINVFRQRGTVAMALRSIAFGIPDMESLGLPTIAEEIGKAQRGLVLVTGPAGSGKSTTLAAMINQINQTMERHIITLEDPIEYLHPHRNSIVVQREIGLDTATFATGLRAALREDPDVILVGELRDIETISTAITAAETGHLVFAAMHTPDAIQTIDRMIDAMPVNQQMQIRYQLANVLVAIFSQKLLPQKNGKGRVAAVEVLVNNLAIANLIRTDKTYQIKNIIQTSGRYGMQTMEQSIHRLLQEDKVDPRDCEAVLQELRQSARI